ncbi:MAG: hypothetical protein JSU90_07645 [Nitrospiraceae bacterium]|nr:MAG: hypothetical protein JSU90_07645 [Nitrospiraceae bacterium]
MRETTHPGKITVLDEKIEQFCQTSAELLAKIHERYGNMASAVTSGKSRADRKKRARKKQETSE